MLHHLFNEGCEKGRIRQQMLMVRPFLVAGEPSGEFPPRYKSSGLSGSLIVLSGTQCK